MEFFTPQLPENATNLGMALVISSSTPLVLLTSDLVVEAASASFCRAFGLDPDHVSGTSLFNLGAGEWRVPQLQSLLRAIISGHTTIDAYEMELKRDAHEPCRLVLNAHMLDYGDAEDVRVVLSVVDVTAARLAETLKDNLVREKQILLQELQHRVANSLQIIASVLMQSARKVQSEETRVHLRDAHHRVMSIATLQKQLAATRLGNVALRPYFNDLCDSIRASMIPDPNLLSLTVTVDDSETTAEVSVSLGLIVTELVINTLKHAFPGRTQKGHITVDYGSDGAAWSLQVGDDGIGMPTDHKDIKPGLGTGIVDALAKQLGAIVAVSPANPGTLVSIAHA